MSRRIPPGPKGAPLVGDLFAFMRDKLGYVQNAAKTYGDIVRYRLGPVIVYQLNHPDYIHEVLVGQGDKFQKAKLDGQIFQQFLGNGLLSANGDFHRQQRKLVQPAFHSKRIENYGQVMVDYTAQMVDGWRDGLTLDIHDAMTKLTLFIVSKTLYDADVSASADGIGEAVHTLNAIGGDQYNQGFVFPKWLPVSQNRRMAQSVAAVDAVMMPIIEGRRKSGEDKGDLLSMLLMAQDEETGTGMSDRQVRDEAVSLFLAGHETTSNALTWTWYLLAQHPEVEAKLHAELDTVLAGRAPTMRDLANLPYTDMVIKEAMRLYPPAWILNGREALEDVEIDGYFVPKGTTIFMSPYVMHHDSRYFDAPDAFQPERWADGLEKRLPRYAYFPFGGGPRVCIGNSFAMMEARLVLAAVAQHYRLSLVPGQTVQLDPLITLRPKDPMMMQAVRRQLTITHQPSVHNLEPLAIGD